MRVFSIIRGFFYFSCANKRKIQMQSQQRPAYVILTGIFFTISGSARNDINY
jgi:hypothetical protein